LLLEHLQVRDVGAVDHEQAQMLDEQRADIAGGDVRTGDVQAEAGSR